MHDPDRPAPDAPNTPEDALLRRHPLGEVEPPLDFLAGVQSKIRERSGGKFFASRWTTSPLATLVHIVALAMLLAIVVVWLLAGPVLDPGPADGAAARPGPPTNEQGRPPMTIRVKGPAAP